MFIMYMLTNIAYVQLETQENNITSQIYRYMLGGGGGAAKAGSRVFYVMKTLFRHI